MSRSVRAALARETLRILGEGGYVLPDGRAVDLAQDLRHCISQTRLLEPETLAALAGRPPAALSACVIEVANESTLAGIRSLLQESRGPVAALNFASARTPGGGFLEGAQAQEESLARSSGLHASLLRCPEFYSRHRRSPSLLYSDALILSPRCPVFRDDGGTLLSAVQHVTFFSCAAPNAGALRDHRSPELSQVPDALQRRISQILALAAAEGYRRIVLGAWGCGVFRNDPVRVAQAFLAQLRRQGWAGCFEKVRFSVLDPAADGRTFGAFRTATAGSESPIMWMGPQGAPPP